MYSFNISTIPHIFYFSNAYNPECLAPYGGPIEQGVAFGGVFAGKNKTEKPDYSKATGMVLTFLVRNHLSKKDQEPARLWEKR